MRTISRLSPVALTLITALGAPGVLAQSDAAASTSTAGDEADVGDETAPTDAVDEGADGAEPGAGTDAASASEDEAGADAPEADADAASARAEDGTDASASDEAGGEPTTEPTTKEDGFKVTVGDTAFGNGTAEDQAAHDAAVEVETDNLRRALYAGIGMGALGALAGVASIAATAGAVAMLTGPNLDPTIRTQGGPLLWFGISGILVGAVTTAAGGGLIGWSLLSDPEEAADAVGNADPDAATTQQNAPPMAR